MGAKEFLPFHPNGMKYCAIDAKGTRSDEWIVYSIGGGALAEEGTSTIETPDIYSMNSMTEILIWCEKTGRSYWEYVEECEGQEIWDYLREVWKVMKAAVERGLDNEGVLPGPLNLRRKASAYFIKASGFQAKPSQPRTGVLLRPCRERRECVWRGDCHGTYLRFVRSSASCALSPSEDPRIQRDANTPRVGNSRFVGNV